ncbi:hypothetical protein F5879DRAFT_222471 [Lentinula edodes]|nr:hypothetical protein F5879DRAFT_222471 [Lentinula edodes]
MVAPKRHGGVLWLMTWQSSMLLRLRRTTRENEGSDASSVRRKPPQSPHESVFPSYWHRPRFPDADSVATGLRLESAEHYNACNREGYTGREIQRLVDPWNLLHLVLGLLILHHTKL